MMLIYYEEENSPSALISPCLLTCLKPEAAILDSGGNELKSGRLKNPNIKTRTPLP